MPKKLKRKLRRQALKLQAKGELKGSVDSYVYGTMSKIEKAK